MRICMLLRNTFTRDARVLREATSLASAGHDVTVLAVHAGDLPEREERDGFVVLRGVEAGALAGPTITGGASRARARSLPRPPGLVWARDSLLASRMTKAAMKLEADAYHAHDLPTLGSAVKAAKVHNAFVVYDAHELWPDLTGLGRFERLRWLRTERRLINEADAVIVPSEARGEELVKRYGIGMPSVVMNVPPLPRTPPDPAASPLSGLRREGETLLVYAGGYTPNRGLENVMRAMSLLEGFRLVMIGWGPLESRLRSLAPDNVVFLDPVEPDEVIPTIAGADIGLAPYLPIGRNNELAAPNKIFEYLHAGLAVVASDLPEIRVIVERHDVGCVFDASNPSSIAEAVNRTKGRGDQLRNASSVASREFVWKREELALQGAYASLRRIERTPDGE